MPLSDAVERAQKQYADAGDIEQAAFGPIDQARILQLVGLNPRDPKAHAVVAVARRYALDPVLGHIALITASATPYITRDGYIHIAHRSGHLDGIEVCDGPRREASEWVCTVAVYRNDMNHPFIYPGRADIANTNGPELAIARGERRALKRAFAVTLPPEFGDDSDAPLSAPQRQDLSEPRPADTPAPDKRARTLTEAQRREIWALWQQLGMAAEQQREERLNDLDRIIGHPVESSKELSEKEAELVITVLRNRIAERNERKGKENGG